MTTEEIHKLPYKVQLYINDLQRKIKDLLKKDKKGYNNIEDTDPNWENYIKNKQL